MESEVPNRWMGGTEEGDRVPPLPVGWSACFVCFFFSSAVLHRVFAKVMRIANRVVTYNIFLPRGITILRNRHFKEFSDQSPLFFPPYPGT